MISGFNVKKSIKVNKTGVKLALGEGLNKQVSRNLRKEVIRLMPPDVCKLLRESNATLYLTYMGEISLQWRRTKWQRLYLN